MFASMSVSRRELRKGMATLGVVTKMRMPAVLAGADAAAAVAIVGCVASLPAAAAAVAFMPVCGAVQAEATVSLHVTSYSASH